MNKSTTFFTLATLSSLFLFSLNAQAGKDNLIENSSSGILKDTFTVSYEYDDFTDEVTNADLLFIPADYQSEAAFFMRCRPFFTNLSVEFLEHESNLKERDGSLENDSAKFEKHGYLYDTKHRLTIKTKNDSERMSVAVGGQNNHLTKHFKTDIPKTAGLLGMSFHFTFNYLEMPSFRSVGNTTESKDAFKLLNRAFKQQTPLQFELDGRNAEDRNFTLNTQRLQKFAPQRVIDFCFRDRKLRD